MSDTREQEAPTVSDVFDLAKMNLRIAKESQAKLAEVESIVIGLVIVVVCLYVIKGARK